MGGTSLVSASVDGTGSAETDSQGSVDGDFAIGTGTVFANGDSASSDGSGYAQFGAGAGSIGTESGSSVMGDGMSSGSFQTTIDALFNGVRQTGESTALTSSSAIGEKASADSSASAEAEAGGTAVGNAGSASAWSENGASAATAGAAGAQSNLGSTLLLLEHPPQLEDQ